MFCCSSAGLTAAQHREPALTIEVQPEQFAAARREASLLWLLGQPHLEEYLTFVSRRVVGGAAMPAAELAAEWRAANDEFHALEQREAGEADRIAVRPLSPRLAALAQDVRDDPWFRATFDALPTTIEMVELDRLITWQGQVDDTFAGHRVRGLGARPGGEALFRYCLPLRRDPPPFSVRRLSSDRYQLISEATDMGALSPRLLGPEQCAALATSGPIAAALAIPVAFGANLMSAIRSDTRVLLHNGYHRAYALRAMGVRYAPCIIQTVTRLDELKYAADIRVASDPAFYFRAARPPMLRDFFNPLLVKRLAVHPIQTVVDIQVTATHWSASDLPAGAR